MHIQIIVKSITIFYFRSAEVFIFKLYLHFIF